MGCIRVPEGLSRLHGGSSPLICSRPRSIGEGEEQAMADEQPDDLSEEPRGRVDTASVLYVVGGIPVIMLFIVGLFLLVGACDQMNVPIPA